jgi:hypothetical protein
MMAEAPARARRRIPRGAFVAAIAAVGLLAAALGAVAYGLRQAGGQEAGEPVRTARIERESLAATMVLTGTLGYGDPRELAGGGGMVTGLPEPGSVLGAGQVLMEVEGRPVFVLRGEVPLWRVVGPGVVGPDVAALRAGLAGVGIEAGQAGETRYDAALSAGIGELYAGAGFDPPADLASDDEAVVEAKAALAAAERAYEEAGAALAAAGGRKPGAVEVLVADNAVKAAQRALKAARSSGAGDGVEAAREALALARALRAEALAPKDTSLEQAALDQANAQLELARGELAAVAAGDAEARRQAQELLAAAQGGLAAAKQALEEAKKPPSKARRLELDSAVAAAERALAAAKKGEGSGAVAEAKEALAAARAQRQALDQPPEAAAEAQALEFARRDRQAARAALEEAASNAVGPRDVLVVDAAAIRIDQVRAKVGELAEGPVVTWTETVLHGRVDLTEAQRARMAAGAQVSVSLPGGAVLPGVVGEIKNAYTDPETQEMVPARARIDIEDQGALAGAALATISVSLVQEETEEVLVVPVTALMALAEGGYCVELPGGRLVGVEVGLVADTRAEIRSAELAEGQEVVVP